MAASTLSDALSSFTTATLSAHDSLPTFSPDTETETSQSGISLLSAKNEIFLSYLQVLALRNLHTLRSFRAEQSSQQENGDAQGKELEESLTKKLCELRVYIERGVRPLEGKIGYQVGKVIRAAEEEDRGAASAALASKRGGKKGKAKRINGKTNHEDDSGSEEDEDEDDDEDSDSDASTTVKPGIASTTHRANAAAFARPAATADSASDTRAKSSTNAKDGIYRPPRISATTMPTTNPSPDDPSTSKRDQRSRPPPRSATLEDYISTELSSAPRAEPSIGSTIGSRGRSEKSSRQLAKEAERRNYEETNLVRLPKESKKVLAKERARERERGGFGGEEWRGLGESVDRIAGLTRSGNSGGARGMLERSRKRKVGADDDEGFAGGAGDAFERRKRRVMGRKSMGGGKRG